MLRPAHFAALAVLIAPACSRRVELPGDAAPAAKPTNGADLPDAPTVDHTYTLYFTAGRTRPRAV